MSSRKYQKDISLHINKEQYNYYNPFMDGETDEDIPQKSCPKCWTNRCHRDDTMCEVCHIYYDIEHILYASPRMDRSIEPPKQVDGESSEYQKTTHFGFFPKSTLTLPDTTNFDQCDKWHMVSTSFSKYELNLPVYSDLLCSYIKKYVPFQAVLCLKFHCDRCRKQSVTHNIESGTITLEKFYTSRSKNAYYECQEMFDCGCKDSRVIYYDFCEECFWEHPILKAERNLLVARLLQKNLVPDLWKLCCP